MLNRTDVFHAFGFACLSGMIFLALLTFASIWHHGYFLGYEPNKLILFGETIMLAYGLIYFLFLVRKFLAS